MKNSPLLIAFVILLFCQITNLSAQGYQPILEGNFKYVNKEYPERVELAYSKESNDWDRPTIIQATPSANNQYLFKLPIIKKPTLFNIKLIKSGKYSALGKVGRYYAEPGDRIRFTIFQTKKKDSIIFFGKGSEKYNLIEKIIALDDFDKFIGDQHGPNDSLGIDLFLKRLWKFTERYNTRTTNLINNFKGLNKEMKILINYEFNHFNIIWASKLYYMYNVTYSKNNQARMQIKKAFDLTLNKAWKVENPIGLLSTMHFIEVADLLKTKMLFNNNGEISMVSYYNELKKIGYGLIKERLITEFFISGYTMGGLINYTPEAFDSLVIDAKKNVREPYYENLISEKTRTRRGAKLHEGHFINLQGTSFSLDSLKGKVFLIDVWAEGCGGCVEFHRSFEKSIYPSLKKDSNFVILSIGGDSIKEKWLANLNRGLYSSKEFKNVWIGSLGLTDPFFQYYGNALPLLLIVDKEGRIVTRIKGSESPQEIVNIITQELRKPILTSLTRPTLFN